MYALEVFQWIFSMLPFITARGMTLLFSTDFFFSPYDRTDISCNILIGNHYMSPNKQTEIAVDMKDCISALDTFIETVHSHDIPLNHILEVNNNCIKNTISVL